MASTKKKKAETSSRRPTDQSAADRRWRAHCEAAFRTTAAVGAARTENGRPRERPQEAHRQLREQLRSDVAPGTVRPFVELTSVHLRAGRQQAGAGGEAVVRRASLRARDDNAEEGMPSEQS